MADPRTIRDRKLGGRGSVCETTRADATPFGSAAPGIAAVDFPPESSGSPRPVVAEAEETVMAR
jgi:hypothetical protein